VDTGVQERFWSDVDGELIPVASILAAHQGRVSTVTQDGIAARGVTKQATEQPPRGAPEVPTIITENDLNAIQKSARGALFAPPSAACSIRCDHLLGARGC
jgi:hypothetical protein